MIYRDRKLVEKTEDLPLRILVLQCTHFVMHIQFIVVTYCLDRAYAVLSPDTQSLMSAVRIQTLAKS